jgi:hypothetical protein
MVLLKHQMDLLSKDVGTLRDNVAEICRLLKLHGVPPCKEPTTTSLGGMGATNSTARDEGSIDIEEIKSSKVTQFFKVDCSHLCPLATQLSSSSIHTSVHTSPLSQQTLP